LVAYKNTTKENKAQGNKSNEQSSRWQAIVIGYNFVVQEAFFYFY